LRVAKQVQKVRKGAPRVLLIPNRMQAGYRLTRELLEAAGDLGVPTLTGLRQRQAFAEAGTQGTVVWRLGRSADEASDEVFRLYDEIEHYATQIPS
jgi:chromosome partitioning protein